MPHGRVGLFGDSIFDNAAFDRGLSLMDLRMICSAPEDYANPIEPSQQGGRKIATAIARLAQLPSAASTHSIVIAG